MPILGKLCSFGSSQRHKGPRRSRCGFSCCAFARACAGSAVAKVAAESRTCAAIRPALSAWCSTGARTRICSGNKRCAGSIHSSASRTTYSQKMGGYGWTAKWLCCRFAGNLRLLQRSRHARSFFIFFACCRRWITQRRITLRWKISALDRLAAVPSWAASLTNTPLMSSSPG